MIERKWVVAMLKRYLWVLISLLLIPSFSACRVEIHSPEMPSLEDEGDVDLVAQGSEKDTLAGEPIVPKYFDGLYGFVDMEGRVAIPAQFTYADLMREGLAYAEKGEDKFVIDNQGKIVFPIDSYLEFDENGEIVSPTDRGFRFAFLSSYVDGIAVLAYGNLYGAFNDIHFQYLDREGKNNFGKVYANASYFSEGLAYVEEEANGKSGYIDKQGNYVIELDESMNSAGYFHEGRARVNKKAANGYSSGDGYINKKGDFVISPKFRGAYSFSEGIARVNQFPGLFGYLDLDGNWLIEPQYEDATDFIDGKAVVNGDTVIDKSGNTLAKAPEDIYLKGPFSEGLAAARMKEGDHRLTGYVDEDFNWVIPPIYEDDDYTEECNNGLICISTDEWPTDGFIYYFNRDGKMLAKNPWRPGHF